MPSWFDFARLMNNCNSVQMKQYQIKAECVCVLAAV